MESTRRSSASRIWWSKARAQPLGLRVFRRRIWAVTLAACTAHAACLAGNGYWAGAGRVSAAQPPAAQSPAKTSGTPDELAASVRRGIAYLETKGQADDGSFTSAAGIGVTALATTALLRNGRPVDSPAVAKALKYLEQFVQEDGGIYSPNSRFRNYETALSVVCLAEANRDRRYAKVLSRADAYLKGLQREGTAEVKPDDPAFGGSGYGGRGRPDLSNTSYMIEALRAAGNSADSQAIQDALRFVSRCQNLEGPHNTTRFAAKVQDGGFYYTPVGDGSSPAGLTENGGLRSYGSMTYAGLKSMVYAGVGPDDPRVRAAREWIAANYSVGENPGLGQAGVFYYYQLFAKALAAVGDKQISDRSGRQHDWRAELIAALARRQQPDGSWVNPNGKWLEGDANLCTAFSLAALAYCRESN